MRSPREKKLLAAWVGEELHEAVDRWWAMHPRKSVTDFLIDASIEKLEREGIDFDKLSATWDGRTKQPVSYSRSMNPAVELNEKVVKPKKS